MGLPTVVLSEMRAGIAKSESPMGDANSHVP
jgi:hypothetical protein